MTIFERIEHFASAFYAALGTAVAGAMVFLVRRILTSAHKIDMLEKEIAAREKRREEELTYEREDRAKMVTFMAQTKTGIDNIQRDQHEMRTDIKNLFKMSGEK